MRAEAQRRAWLEAMALEVWQPRLVLPNAAPARPVWQAADQPVAPSALKPEPVRTPATPPVLRDVLSPPVARVVVLPSAKPSAPPAKVVALRPSPAEPEPIPQFALQVLQAGRCLLVVDLPMGEAFQARDPAYLLLRDLLRAAGLPDSPSILGGGEPIRWPLLSKGNLEQGAEAAQIYVQAVLASNQEQMEDCACLWLLGPHAVRFAGGLDLSSGWKSQTVHGLGAALSMPSLDQLMEQPALKAELWALMCRTQSCWIPES